MLVNVLGLFLGLLIIFGGIMLIRYRAAVARWNADLLRRGGGMWDREAKKSTPVQFLMAGIVALVAGAFTTVFMVLRIAEGTG